MGLKVQKMEIPRGRNSIRVSGGVREEKIQSKCFLVFQFARIFFDTHGALKTSQTTINRLHLRPDNERKLFAGSSIRKSPPSPFHPPPPQIRQNFSINRTASAFPPFFSLPFREEITPSQRVDKNREY